ncbi:MAG TPA: fuculose phosphate aldolase, partial [Caldanaerobacter subterraneus]
MLLKYEREQIVEYGKKLIDTNLTRGTGGNLSVYDYKSGLMAITPSGMDYYELKAEDILVMDLEGKVVEGTKVPST